MGGARPRRGPRAGGRSLAAACVLAAVAASACGATPAVAPGTGPGDAPLSPYLATLETTTVAVGARVLRVAIADEPGTRSRGLAGTRDLGGLDGMLFAYPEPVERAFWMRGVLFPLDIAFVGSDGHVLTVRTMPVCAADPCPTYAPPGPFRWAIETPAGGLGGLASGDIVTIRGG